MVVAWAAGVRGPEVAAAMIGVVLILIVMFVAGPIGLFLVAAIWSALFGWMVGDDADQRGNADAQASGS
jgi:hypothetical protein